MVCPSVLTTDFLSDRHTDIEVFRITRYNGGKRDSGFECPRPVSVLCRSKKLFTRINSLRDHWKSAQGNAWIRKLDLQPFDGEL